MYLQVWNHWACWCHLHSTIPAEAPLSLILDFLHASDLFKKKKNVEPSRTRMSTCGIIWIYTAWATVVCDLDACNGSHDMVVCILFGRLCWFWLAECISGLVMHTTMVFVSMVGFATEFGSTMLL